MSAASKTARVKSSPRAGPTSPHPGTAGCSSGLAQACQRVARMLKERELPNSGCTKETPATSGRPGVCGDPTAATLSARAPVEERPPLTGHAAADPSCPARDPCFLGQAHSRVLRARSLLPLGRPRWVRQLTTFLLPSTPREFPQTDDTCMTSGDSMPKCNTYTATAASPPPPAEGRASSSANPRRLFLRCCPRSTPQGSLWGHLQSLFSDVRGGFPPTT